MFGVTPEVAAMVGVVARIRANASDDGLAGGCYCGAFVDKEVDGVLVPAMVVGLDAILQRDCPEAVCEPDTPGQQVSTFFDDDEDGRITSTV